MPAGIECPRCGGVARWVERAKRGARTYFVAVHEVIEGGKKKRKKCYLGPGRYEYVSRLHRDIGIVLRGAVDSDRVMSYIDELAGALTARALDEGLLSEVLDKLTHLVQVVRARIGGKKEGEAGGGLARAQDTTAGAHDGKNAG